MKRFATICVRGGSKGLPGKNWGDMLGRPLMSYTVKHAVATSIFDEIIVSSDDDHLLTLGSETGATRIVKRPAALANDQAGKLDAIAHAVATVEANFGKADTVVDLDATSPLRDPDHIVEAVNLIESRGIGSLLSANSARKSPYFNLVERSPSGGIELCKKLDTPLLRRQDAPAVYELNGSIYCWNRDRFMSSPQIFYEDTDLYVMPVESSHDIDTISDWNFVEFLLSRPS